MIHESRRVVFPEAHVVQFETVEIRDDDLGPFEVVTRTHRTLISPGTELARLQGKLMFDSEVPPPFPKTDVGYANIGTVIAAGSEARIYMLPSSRCGRNSTPSERTPMNAPMTMAAPAPIANNWLRKQNAATGS